ncbi:hypothetical protein FKP32DRAFT_1103793 [Trametes sanguinea]|nr:hypothetical protein FKP32DRAFT_1103793 [Trametes sanguinea]
MDGFADSHLPEILPQSDLRMSEAFADACQTAAIQRHKSEGVSVYRRQVRRITVFLGHEPSALPPPLGNPWLRHGHVRSARSLRTTESMINGAEHRDVLRLAYRTYTTAPNNAPAAIREPVENRSSVRSSRCFFYTAVIAVPAVQSYCQKICAPRQAFVQVPLKPPIVIYTRLAYITLRS